MKKNVIILCTLGLVFLMAGICQAAPYYGPIVMVEADPANALNPEMDVTVTLGLLDSSWIMGESIGGSFTPFTDGDLTSAGTQVTRSGGTVVDFAIKLSGTNTVLKLSDGGHQVVFWNPNSGTVQAPTWVTEWYDDAVINWVGGPAIGIEIVATDGDPDGLAAVPIPASALLLGSGIVGLIAFGRVRMRRSP